MNAKKLHDRDQRERESADLCGMAFVSPTVPKPKTLTEKKAREIVADFVDIDRAVTIHIYDVIEIAEKAFAAGVKHGKESKK